MLIHWRSANFLMMWSNWCARMQLARRVKLEVTAEAGAPRVVGDRIHLQQVLLNLVINALDALAASGHPEQEVAIRAQPQLAGYVEVSVIDNGPGIPPDLLDKVFEAFFTTKPDGMGMGFGDFPGDHPSSWRPDHRRKPDRGWSDFPVYVAGSRD